MWVTSKASVVRSGHSFLQILTIFAKKEEKGSLSKISVEVLEYSEEARGAASLAPMSLVGEIMLCGGQLRLCVVTSDLTLLVSRVSGNL
jgi:hypothetical protein